jgi:hypothetical protein
MHKPPTECNFYNKFGKAQQSFFLTSVVGTWAILADEMVWPVAAQLVRKPESGPV